MAEIAREIEYVFTTKKGGQIMKKMQSLYKQTRKIVLLALLILPCICMACGLKVTTHQLDPEAVSQENYATIIYDKDAKIANIYYKLSIDGKMVEANKWGSDHYQVKPGLHRLVFEKREVQLSRMTYDKELKKFTLHKNDIIFESLPGGKYKIDCKLICASEETEGEKSLDFFTLHQVMIREADSGRIVNKPIAGVFQPLIEEETIQIFSWKTRQIPILHLYNNTKSTGNKIVLLGVDRPMKGARIETISGKTNNGTKILLQNFSFSRLEYRVIPELKKKLIDWGIGSEFFVFALLPGTYVIEVSYRGSAGHALANSYIPLIAIAGNSYKIGYKFSGSGYKKKIHYLIKNVTGEEKW